MRKPLSLVCLRRRIIRSFAVQLRWLHFHELRISAHVSRIHIEEFCEALASLQMDGRVISIYDRAPSAMCFRYIDTQLLASPKRLAEECKPAKGGLMECHVRVMN